MLRFHCFTALVVMAASLACCSGQLQRADGRGNAEDSALSDGGAPRVDRGPADGASSLLDEGTPTTCGDNVCGAGENCANCPGDCACAAPRRCLQAPCAGRCATVFAGEKTGAAVQAAINAATAGETLFLPAGDYLFAQTVEVSKPLTICGESELQGVAIMEQGSEVPPAWSKPPTRCYSKTDITLLDVTSNDVTLVGLKLEGIAETSGEGVGVQIAEHDNVTVRGCESAHLMRGVFFQQAQDGLVEDSFLHDNYVSGMGYGVSISGTSMTSGGSRVVMRHCEFANNRHDIATNSPETRWLADHCYFRDNHQGDSYNQPSVDAHPQGVATLRLTVRNSTFKNTRPMGMKSGIWEITNNTIHASCGSVINQMIMVGEPTHNDNVIAGAVNHDIYIGENVDESGKTFVYVKPYDGKWVEYNLFVDGQLWEGVHTDYPPYSTGPQPFVGHIYVSTKDGDEPLETIKRDTWYDLHLMAVDAQKAGDIALIGAQLLAVGRAAHTPDVVAEGAFAERDNYYLRVEHPDVSTTKTFARESEGQGTWSPVTATGRYLDATATSWGTKGDYRVHLRVRFKLLPQATLGPWHLYGFVRDKSNNVPIAAWLAEQEGWPLSVSP